jgi:gluconate 2-dehydrogenase gamma chain
VGRVLETGEPKEYYDPMSLLKDEPGITRRTVIATAATAAFVPVTAIRCAAQNPNQPRSLTAAQRRTTEMLVDRIVPADELGPGALECGAANYIDIQMADYLAPQKDGWVAGLAALDAFATEMQGAAFADLSAEKRDAVLMAIAGEGPRNLKEFFNTARTYTMQGTFGDPHYGGNIGGRGWDIIRYPGPRPATTPDMQRMDKEAEPYRRSAWGNG